MAELKTQPNPANVEAFLAAVADPARRADAQAACHLMTEVTGQPPVMWGTSIVGFGSYRYRYASGRKGESMAVGLSPRKQALTLYFSDGFDGREEIMARLGTFTTGRSCLYLKRLSDADQTALRQLVSAAFTHLNGTTVTT